MRMPALKLSPFWICAAVVVLVGVALTIFDVIAINKFIFFAGYVVLQYVVLVDRLEHHGRLHGLR